MVDAPGHAGRARFAKKDAMMVWKYSPLRRDAGHEPVRRAPRGRRSSRLLLEALETRTLLSSAPPTGAVEKLNLATVSGWAFSSTDGSASLNVVISINGQQTTIVADKDRPDLLGGLGSENHGFTYSLPGLPTGNNTITVDAADPLTGLVSRLVSSTLYVAPPIGSVEVFNSKTISGWAYSAANQSAPLNVVITIDGTATTLTANQNRADLAPYFGSANHGFTYSVPGLSTGSHSVTVDLIDGSTSAVIHILKSSLYIAPPIGSVEVINRNTISGWAYSAANQSAPLNVVITIDGTATTITANQNRADLAPYFGSANHGFTYSVPGLSTGTHAVMVDIIDGSTSAVIHILKSSIYIAPPIGSVEVFNSKTISGWAFGAANQSAPLNVVITIDGTPTTITANQNRTDLAPYFGSANHGFTYSVPGLSTGSHGVTVDLIDGSTSAVIHILKSSIYIAPPIGSVEVFNSKTISGWAFGAANQSAPLNVVITIDGTATTVTANQNRADLAPYFGSANHGFSYSVPGLSSGSHSVTVDLVDGSTSAVIHILRSSLYIAPPIGSVEVFNSKTISGWAFGAANQSAPLNVVITVDGTATTITANQNRADLAPYFGSANHGFSYSVPSLATGTHAVTVDMIDGSTSAVIRILNSSLTVAPPIGSVEVFNRNTISGWAFSSANNSAPLQIVIAIDGVAATFTANQNRADLAPYFGSANHGFTYSLPALSMGSHAVTLDIIDGSTGQVRRLLASSIYVGPPAGAVEVVNTHTISGWAFNPASSAAPVNVIITINGTPTTVSANQYRGDLAGYFGSAYHGYSFTVPALTPGTSSVTVDLSDPSTGQTLRLWAGALYNTPPVGSVDISSATEIAGWAYDPDANGPVQVRVDVNGTPLGNPLTANNTRIMAGTYGIGFDVSGNFGGKVVEVYAYDQPSNTAVLIWTNNHAPRGAVNTLTGYKVIGWAVDPDAPSTPVNVRVDIDGVTLTTVAANIQRPDVQAQAGALNVGYSLDIPGLTPGTHTISVYAIDGQAKSAAPVLLGSQVVTNAPPVGKVEVINTSIVSGYAYDPDLGANPTTVNLYVDEQYYATMQANGTDTAQPNHGFSFDLSALPAGSHAITLTVMDDRTSDGQEVIFYDDFINNHTPIGAIQSVTGTTITGWAQDPDTPTSPIAVDIYVDGKFSVTVTANINQPGLQGTLGSTNHGFSTALPALSFGTHTIAAYASESQGNVSSLIGTVTTTNNRPYGVVEAVSATTVSGWAVDPDRSTESVAIQVYVNGSLAASGIANQTRNDLVARLGSANHGFSLSLPSLSSGSNKIDIYAVDLNNGLISLLGSQTIVV